MKKRILASVLVLVMLICLLPVTAIADGNEGWKVDGQTVRIYTAEGLRAWADSITHGEGADSNYGCTRYNGFTVSIENDIDLSDAAWTSIIGLGGTITIDGNGYTISNMQINEQGNGERGNTYLGFIGDIAYGTRLTMHMCRTGAAIRSIVGAAWLSGMDRWTKSVRRRIQNARSGMSQSKTVL